MKRGADWRGGGRVAVEVTLDELEPIGHGEVMPRGETGTTEDAGEGRDVLVHADVQAGSVEHKTTDATFEALKGVRGEALVEEAVFDLGPEDLFEHVASFTCADGNGADVVDDVLGGLTGHADGGLGVEAW